MRCLFLMPCIAIMALLLLLAPTHKKGPVYLLPVNRRVRRQYIPRRYGTGTATLGAPTPTATVYGGQAYSSSISSVSSTPRPPLSRQHHAATMHQSRSPR